MNHAQNLVWQTGTVTRELRLARNGHRSFVVWFTGLSGAGKSTLAHALEAHLFAQGLSAFVIDGDNIRHGLCADLGFSAEDRKENIRRVGELARLFIEAGTIAITAFISPFRADRETVRRLIPTGEFIEIHCRCPLETCEARDVKGLYQKAREGRIPEFTGISSPYEQPENPELVLDTHLMPLEECIERIMNLLVCRNLLALSQQ